MQRRPEDRGAEADTEHRWGPRTAGGSPRLHAAGRAAERARLRSLYGEDRVLESVASPGRKDALI